MTILMERTMANPITLADKFDSRTGRIFLSGTQAIARIFLDQKARDEAQGLNTAGYISGYRGSPLGGLDTALWRAQKWLDGAGIVFQPGVNEELAASAVFGTQQVSFFPGAKVEGVFAGWYGKGPGVDRAGDALKHGNLAGTSKHGGVLVFAGDDHPGKSSTTAHQSEQALVAALIPVLYPASVGDYLEYGSFGFAISRYSGLWVGFKCINDTADATASCATVPVDHKWTEPEEIGAPPEGLNIVKGETQLAQERRTVEHKLQAAQRFVRANGMDRVLRDSPKRTIGIISAGKAALDTIDALEQLGLTEDRCAKLGIRLLKLALTWPVEPETVREFCEKHHTIIVVEEKRAFIEPQIAAILYPLDAAFRPKLAGKTDTSGDTLLSSINELSPLMIQRAIRREIELGGFADKDLANKFAALDQSGAAIGQAVTEFGRMPFFCSGCPHNTSTKVPDGTVALSGIGCHVMAALMPHRPHSWPIQMGGEGANWIGAAPFSETDHVFQNLGDGTYYHSGSLAIRAAIASGTNITFKLLYNDAVAMTGGQPLEGQLTPAQIAHSLLAEGVKSVVVVADDPAKYGTSHGFPPQVKIHPREELDLVQKQLADVRGTTVLIYDQVCAAEKRRRRKRGTFPDPAKRMFINDLVCEGCGDCSAKSNCVSIQPLETEFGRKRRIDQSSCNKDFSCANGFCPSFVSVEGGSVAGSTAATSGSALPALPPIVVPAVRPIDRTWSLLITGIGGTGVVTIGAVLGMAAHIDGKAASLIDMTGLSQKNGAVFSHVRIAADPDQKFAARIGPGAADLILGCDMIAAAGAEGMATVHLGRTVGIINDDVSPTAAFTINTEIDFKVPATKKRLREALHTDQSLFINATEISVRLLGDSIGANLLLLGAAIQRGEIPVSLAAIEEAIRLNNVSVAMNLYALALGRLVVADPDALDQLLAKASGGQEQQSENLLAPTNDLGLAIERRAEFLAAYQDEAYAQKFRSKVSATQKLEQNRVGARDDLTWAVTRNLFKLMAYKDEYEVARLYTSGEFEAKLKRQLEGDYRLKFHLSPPLIAPRDKATGLPRKIEFGGWMLGVFKVLAQFKGLRGSAFDPFGYTAERKNERRLIDDYLAMLAELEFSLTAQNWEHAVALARLPEKIKGFGHVKDGNAKLAEERAREIWGQYRSASVMVELGKEGTNRLKAVRAS
jgi:indolepyruvate ferredoxin oxidoreductase